MPIYEYHCNDCGRNFEYLVIGKDDSQCLACRSNNVCRVMSPCCFISKGSGGEAMSSSASASSCSGCSSSSCAGCGQ